MNVARKRDGQGRSSTALGAAYLTASFTLGAGAAIADPIPLPDYLASIDRTEISFSGRIRYDSSKDSFTFYDDNRNPFGVSLDAGRDARERIESECDNPSFMVSNSDLTYLHLAIKVTRREALTKQFHKMHLGFDAASAVVSGHPSP